MSNKHQQLDAYDVPDPTDWLETPLKSLSAVDAALRCQVCKDFYKTPMITSCSHTFCSLCIRRCLGNDGKCPACRTADQELKLRNNAAMEDLVEGFKKARPEVFAFATRPIAPAGESAPKRGREKSHAVDDEEPASKRTRSTRQTRSTQQVVIVDSDQEDDEYIPEDGCVQCPICSKRVKEASINSHIDRGCPDEPAKFNVSKKASILPAKGKAPEKRPERLAQVHYATMKDAVLRKKLAEHSIPTWGTKAEMQRRFTEWVTLWNANCDATHPKSKAELRGELDVWERTQGAHASQMNSSGAQIRSKDFDREAWSNRNDDTFKQLIAQAKQKAQESKKLVESRPKSPLLSPPVSSVPEASSIPAPLVDPVRDSNPPTTFLQEFERQAELFRQDEDRRAAERAVKESSSPIKQNSQTHNVNEWSTPPTMQDWHHQFELFNQQKDRLAAERVAKGSSSSIKQNSQPYNSNEWSTPPTMQDWNRQTELFYQHEAKLAAERAAKESPSPKKQNSQPHASNLQPTPADNEFQGPYEMHRAGFQTPGSQNGVTENSATHNTHNGQYGLPDRNDQRPSPRPRVPGGNEGRPDPDSDKYPGMYPAYATHSNGFENGSSYHEKPEWFQ
ncbi:hypothetical protein HYFRA_00004942 [Hymenoscyphus fraxineus]|uniref:Postreplication repair E3 ubiquitin-protein ligase RAD18 n=1 Tax=Hymenoscyphus fraxineus TaxID=746836 RepID=A0A9N9KLR6_9HELO|nr:hypothetical protein HYFRA_00004942 [Hymenoscyphus fraxineus]